MAAAKMSVAELEKFLREEFPQRQRWRYHHRKRRWPEPACCAGDSTTACCARRNGVRATLMAMADVAMYVVLLSAMARLGLQ